jgi:hypothetical protein
MDIDREVNLMVRCPCCGYAYEVNEVVTVEVEPEDLRGDLD